MKKSFWILPAILLGLCTAEAKIVDRIVAQVNDEIITLSELNRKMAEVRQSLEAKYAGDQLTQMLQQAEKQALESLIEEKLLYQKAMELGYNANVDAQVSAYVQRIMKENNIKDTDELESALAQQGTNLKDFRDDIRRQVMRSDLVNDFVGSRITLLTPEIEKYYRDHPADFTTPEEVTLSEIIVTGEENDKESENRANDLYSRLQQGESFSALASQYSKGPTANKSGNIGAYLISKLNPETVKAIANLKEGEVSKPQKIKEGYVMYHIDGRKYAVLRALDEVKDEIRNLLFQQKLAPEYQRFISQLKEDAYINYPPEIK
jgi:peptidyl-prolyl cis-trans isomerase SurA